MLRLARLRTVSAAARRGVTAAARPRAVRRRPPAAVLPAVPRVSLGGGGLLPGRPPRRGGAKKAATPASEEERREEEERGDGGGGGGGDPRNRYTWQSGGLVAVLALLGGNAAVYLAFALAGDEATAGMRRSLLLSLDAVRDEGRVSTLLSHMFVHEGLLHAGANLMGIAVFGPLLGATLGAGRLLAVFVGSGLAGGLSYLAEQAARERAEPEGRLVEREVRVRELDHHVQLPSGGALVLPSPETRTVAARQPWGERRAEGASAALFGLVGVYATLFPRHKFVLIFFPFRALGIRYLLAGAMAFDAVAMLRGWDTGIGHSGHLGGALAGLAYGAVNRPALLRSVRSAVREARSGRLAPDLARLIRRAGRDYSGKRKARKRRKPAARAASGGGGEGGARSVRWTDARR